MEYDRIATISISTVRARQTADLVFQAGLHKVKDDMDPSHSTDKDVGRDTSTEQGKGKGVATDEIQERKFMRPHQPGGHDQGIAGSSGAVNVPVQISPHQRLAPPVLSTTMSTTRNMQTSSTACHLGLPTVAGDAHEDAPEATLVVSDEELIPLKIQKVSGNDIVYKNLNDIALQIFGPTIRKRWNGQEKRLKADAKRRLSDTSKATKARQEKHGKHKLGSGGYMKLVARIPANRETRPTHEGLDVHPSSGEHVVGGDHVEHDSGTQHQERDVPQLEDPPSLQCPRLHGLSGAPREPSVPPDSNDLYGVKYKNFKF
ncbi:hypothetical protein SUGI_0825790 [Cryptomeria japonica]|nr:hypothetical protein SUGI_0825790 [Cryptomeria japonica]